MRAGIRVRRVRGGFTVGAGPAAGLRAGFGRFCVQVLRRLGHGLALYGMSVSVGCPPILQVPPTRATPAWWGMELPGHPERLEPGRPPTTLERVLWAGLGKSGGVGAPASGGDGRGAAPRS